MTSKVGVLIASSLGLWAVAFLPARLIWGQTSIIFSSVALGLSVVPAALTLRWAEQRSTSTPQQQILLVFGGTGLRMVFVLGGGLSLWALVPYFRETAFWLWLLLFYLFTLTMEVLLLRKGPSPATGR